MKLFYSMLAGGLVLFGIGSYFSYKYVYDQGIMHGITMYHNQCFEVGGISIDGTTGRAIACNPLGVVPKEELKNYQTN